MRDGPDPNAKVIARAQGMHMNTGANQIWQNFLCLAFEDVVGILYELFMNLSRICTNYLVFTSYDVRIIGVGSRVPRFR